MCPLALVETNCQSVSWCQTCCCISFHAHRSRVVPEFFWIMPWLILLNATIRLAITQPFFIQQVSKWALNNCLCWNPFPHFGQTKRMLSVLFVFCCVEAVVWALFKWLAKRDWWANECWQIGQIKSLVVICVEWVSKWRFTEARLGNNFWHALHSCSRPLVWWATYKNS